MTNDLARWQFATTSIYHFLFVPVTIGLAFLVAILQTAWHRNDKPEFKRLTRFFGTLLLINVAIGVVTGLVQEFEFGMNWSSYSRFVGDVFGGPLAMEGLAAFFLESTFLGLWLFGWDRLPKRVHLACIWMVAIGTMLSAAFIMAANSWMQHPVGYALNGSGQPVLNEHRRAVHEPDVHLGIRARAAGVADHRLDVDARRLGVVPEQATRGAGLPPYGDAVARRADPDARDRAVRRQASSASSRRSTSPQRSPRPRPSGTPASPARSRCSRSAAAATTRFRHRSCRSRTCCHCWPRTRGTARSSA